MVLLRPARLLERGPRIQRSGRIPCVDHLVEGVRREVRWLPEGVPLTIDGPFTPADAALLLLALRDYDRVAAIRALYGTAA